MLTRLHVRNFAIVDQIEVEFAAGMTVLTGETGAGKSILVDALGLVLGERGSAQAVRPGARRAEFSADFDVTALPQVGAWLAERSLDADGDCILRRVIGADGRSRAYINGNSVPVQQLKTIGEYLVDIHGQHFHQSLGRKSVQRDLLDFYGGLLEARSATSAAYEAWQGLDSEMRELLDADADRESRLDLLEFQLAELESLALGDGEFDDLVDERRRLQNRGRLAEGAAGALEALMDAEPGNANSALAEAARGVNALLEYDRDLEAAAQLIESAAIQVGEAATELRRYADSIDMDPARHDEVEERLDAIRAAARKHRVEPGELPALAIRLAAERDDLASAGERGKELEKSVAAARKKYVELAGDLGTRRREAAASLSQEVSTAMHGLGMPGGTFETALDALEIDAARAHGLDDIEFRLSANPGQPLMPLAKVASGGELSRMSLAIQVIGSGGSDIPTMVFDEVDSGVGGGVAEMVGRRLAELGRDRQVLCVTHLPQVAALADQHFRIAKVTDGKATRTTARALGKDERIEELARMLGGVEITGKTLEHAAEMLEGARKKRA